MSTTRKIRTSLVIFVAAISFGVLALSPAAHGAQNKTLHVVSAAYRGYQSCYEQIDPQFWGYMQQ
jgi:ABC-type sulfate transport system substrate-binding protein